MLGRRGPRAAPWGQGTRVDDGVGGDGAGDDGAPDRIACVECGGECGLLAVRGDVAAYRCTECWERFDVVWHPDEVGGGW